MTAAATVAATEEAEVTAAVIAAEETEVTAALACSWGGSADGSKWHGSGTGT